MKLLKRIVLGLVFVAVLIVAGGFLFINLAFDNPKYPQLVSVGPQQTLHIKNADIFTATATTVVNGHDVLVKDGRIAKIFVSGSEEVADATVIDASGHTLLPGFIDFHTHPLSTSSPPWQRAIPNVDHNLQAFLFAGVTTIVSMGIDLDEAQKLDRRLKKGSVTGPSLFYAGSPITIKGGHPQAIADSLVAWPLGYLLPDFAREVTSVAEAEIAVNEAVDQGASFVKLVLDDLPPGVPKLGDEHVAAIVKTAKKRGVKVAAHIGTAADAVRAAEAGVDALNHGVHRGSLSEEQAQRIFKTKVVQSPTLIVFERCSQLALADMQFGLLDRQIEDPEVLASFTPANIKASDSETFLKPWFNEVLASRVQQQKNAATMYRAGVPILVGTDSPLVGNVPGAALHSEMKMLVDSGIPPAEVLLGATARPAAFLFDEPEFGTIEVGKRADLVLVAGDPLQDISATEQITHVIQDGRILERLIPPGRK